MIEPDFTKGDGLIPAIVQEASSGEVLMLAYMNREAWQATLKTGEAHFYSRSRSSLWRKGGTSGHVQKVRSVRLDCDRDTVLLLVDQLGGAACHSGYRSCFFLELEGTSWRECCPKVFDPKEVYK
jgi:phosphoribosyl-AMP cyclohydrolase